MRRARTASPDAALFVCYPTFVDELPGFTVSFGAVLKALIHFAGGGYECSPLRKQIASRAGVSIATVVTAMRWLQDQGVVQVLPDAEQGSRRRLHLLWRRGPRGIHRVAAPPEQQLLPFADPPTHQRLGAQPLGACAQPLGACAQLLGAQGPRAKEVRASERPEDREEPPVGPHGGPTTVPVHRIEEPGPAAAPELARRIAELEASLPGLRGDRRLKARLELAGLRTELAASPAGVRGEAGTASSRVAPGPAPTPGPPEAAPRPQAAPGCTPAAPDAFRVVRKPPEPSQGLPAASQGRAGRVSRDGFYPLDEFERLLDLVVALGGDWSTARRAASWLACRYRDAGNRQTVQHWARAIVELPPDRVRGLVREADRVARSPARYLSRHLASARDPPRRE
jgi:hypothetical protein